MLANVRAKSAAVADMEFRTRAARRSTSAACWAAGLEFIE